MPTTMVSQGSQEPVTEAVNPLDAIPQVLNSAAGTIQAKGLWRGANAGISVVAAISQSARSICPARYARHVARAAEIALMQHLGIDPDEMSLRAIAAWEDKTTQPEVVAALRAGATGRVSKLLGGAA